MMPDLKGLAATGLSANTITKIHHLFNQFPAVERVRLYGSRSKGNFRNGSDIDLTIMEHSLDKGQLATIDLALDDLMTPYTFDLSIFADIKSPQLIEHIQTVGLDFYTRK
jgi:predicted nucleotidyltransferase